MIHWHQDCGRMCEATVETGHCRMTSSSRFVWRRRLSGRRPHNRETISRASRSTTEHLEPFNECSPKRDRNILMEDLVGSRFLPTCARPYGSLNFHGRFISFMRICDVCENSPRGQVCATHLQKKCEQPCLERCGRRWSCQCSFLSQDGL